MQPFDAIHTPLEGTSLIEAGAGTGKTYTITTLVVRLILERELLPEQILVVTFTTAATAELRDRIRRRLKEVKGFLQGDPCMDQTMRQVIDRCGERDNALERLEDALANFDCMPVFTIHGFCQRILGEMAFETGCGFDAELVTEATTIIQSLSDDFWRKTWYRSDPELLALAVQTLKTPDEMAAFYQRHAIPDVHVRPAPDNLPDISFDAFRSQWATTCRQWQADRHEILALLADPGLKANIYGSTERPSDFRKFRHKREEKIAVWARQVDQWVNASGSGFPIPDIATYFRQSQLTRCTKKGRAPINHPFFEGCDRLLSEGDRLTPKMRRYLVVWQARLFHYIDDQLRRYKREHQRLFFDDLLLMVREAVQNGGNGPLRQALRKRYRAALIDEFQDTDGIQNTIFDNLFGGETHRLFMIGDPKQAIYGFRGADVFTYLQASRNAKRRYTLTHNWRSTPGLVTAVNVLFSRSSNPFIWRDIGFQPAIPARAENDDAQMPDPASAPMTLWYIDNPTKKNGRLLLNKKNAAEKIYAAIAEEIKRLTGARSPGKDPMAYGDVAVLVRTNQQARHVKNRLAAARIPAVVYHAGNVFRQPEALDLQRVLAAVADPLSESKVRTALVTRFFAQKGDDLVYQEGPASWWDSLTERFYRYRDLWVRGGFIRMFRRLVAGEKIAARLLTGPSGERYLTNILHMAELLHQAAVERGLGAGELMLWLEKQRHQEGETSETQQMRLESDDDAVTILTIHKSKGLEFPVVFCPFGWEGSGTSKPPALFHPDRKDSQRVLDMGSDSIEESLALAAEERVAEELRLLYVAVTRAKTLCYLVWGRLPSAEYSAFAYLLHHGRDTAPGPPFWASLRSRADTLRRREARAFRDDITDLANRSGGTIAVRNLPQPGDAGSEATVRPAGMIGRARPFSRTIRSSWRMTSFSSLIQSRHEGNEIIDPLPERAEDGFDGVRLTSGPPAAPGVGRIGLFEASARAGLMFHEIFETIDFSAERTDAWQPVIESRTRRHGFAPHWQDTIHATIARVVQTPIAAPSGDGFALCAIGLQDRLNELEFHLPIGAFDAPSLGKAFASCGQVLFQGQLPQLTEQLDFQISGGFLKGYIDLVFRHRGRYYLADWKTNHLGNDFEAYHPQRLAATMEAHFYFLQYHLYTLAVDQYLRSVSPDYAYEKDFGGVFYLFIRGMGSPSGAPSGIFFDRPAPELIDDLRKVILAPDAL